MQTKTIIATALAAVAVAAPAASAMPTEPLGPITKHSPNGTSHQVHDGRDMRTVSSISPGLSQWHQVECPRTFADLRTPDARFATIDYSEHPPLFFAGEFVAFDGLQMQGLREFEGWPRPR